MRIAPRVAAAVTLAVLCASCSGDRENPGADEASGPLTPETYPLTEWPDDRLTMTEELRIDGSEHELVAIGHVLVAEDGGVAFSQGQDHEVRFFGPDGTPDGRIGREGEGPGEFELINELGWKADSLWVYDADQARFSIFAPDRSFVRTEPAPPRGAAGNDDVFLFYGRLRPDGSRLAFYHAEDGSGTSRRSYVRVDSVGAVLAEFATHVRGEDFVSVSGEGFSVSSLRIPFVGTTEYDHFSDGERLVLAKAFVEGPAEGTFHVTAVTTSGDTLFASRYPVDLVPIPDDAIDEEIRNRLADLPDFPGMDGLESAFRSQADVPPFYPPIVQVLAGRDGTTWIRMRTTDEGRPYRVLDPDGEPIGTLVIPADDRIAVAERSTVWVYEWDALDVPSLVRYRVGST